MSSSISRTVITSGTKGSSFKTNESILGDYQSEFKGSLLDMSRGDYVAISCIRAKNVLDTHDGSYLLISYSDESNVQQYLKLYAHDTTGEEIANSLTTQCKPADLEWEWHEDHFEIILNRNNDIKIYATGNTAVKLGIYQIITYNDFTYSSITEDPPRYILSTHNSARIKYITVECDLCNFNTPCVIEYNNQRTTQFSGYVMAVLTRANDFLFKDENLHVQYEITGEPYDFTFHVKDQDGKPVCITPIHIELIKYKKKMSDEFHKKRNAFVYIPKNAKLIDSSFKVEWAAPFNQVAIKQLKSNIQTAILDQNNDEVGVYVLDYNKLPLDLDLNDEPMISPYGVEIPDLTFGSEHRAKHIYKKVFCLYDEEVFTRFRNSYLGDDFKQFFISFLKQKLSEQNYDLTVTETLNGMKFSIKRNLVDCAFIIYFPPNSCVAKLFKPNVITNISTNDKLYPMVFSTKCKTFINNARDIYKLKQDVDWSPINKEPVNINSIKINALFSFNPSNQYELSGFNKLNMDLIIASTFAANCNSALMLNGELYQFSQIDVETVSINVFTAVSDYFRVDLGAANVNEPLASLYNNKTSLSLYNDSYWDWVKFTNPQHEIDFKLKDLRTLYGKTLSNNIPFSSEMLIQLYLK